MLYTLILNYPLFLATTILDILLMLLCNNDGSVGIECSSPLNIFIHVIPEDGQYGPKHVTIIRALIKVTQIWLRTKVFLFISVVKLMNVYVAQSRAVFGITFELG
jgi:hypothetical protein